MCHTIILQGYFPVSRNHEVQQLALVHRDLPSNTFVRNGWLSGIIDWSATGLGGRLRYSQVRTFGRIHRIV
jgi:hypothetical protein